MEYWEFYKKPFKKKRKKRPRKKTNQDTEKIEFWKLVWMYNKIQKEEIIKGHYALCMWKKNQIKNSYTQGELKIIPDA